MWKRGNSAITKRHFAKNFIATEYGDGIKPVAGAQAEGWHDPPEGAAGGFPFVAGHFVAGQGGIDQQVAHAGREVDEGPVDKLPVSHFAAEEQSVVEIFMPVKSNVDGLKELMPVVFLIVEFRSDANAEIRILKQVPEVR